MTRRVMVAGAAVFVVVGLLLASAVMGSRLRSPEQAAAEAAPPSPSLITVAVERRLLAEPVVLRGRVLPGDSVKIRPPSAATGPDSVVTDVLVEAEQSLQEGSVLLTVAGQPVFAVSLPFPLYRDLAGGMSGPDVTEVQRALARMGYGVSVTGVLDRVTQLAVGRFYTDRGFTAPPGSAEAYDGLPASRAAVLAAQAAYDDAVAAGSGLVEAELALDQAKQELAQAELAAGPGLPRSAVIHMREVTGTVTAIPVRIGDVLDTAERVVCELDGGDPYVTAAATSDQVGLIVVGQQAQVVDETSGREADAVVAEVDSEPATDEATGASGFPVRLTFAGEPIAPSEDHTVRVDLTVAAMDTPTNAVPLTAVYSRADGSTFVTVLRPDGSTVDIAVVTGQIAGGWVEVKPVGGSPLTPGDLVVVGHSGV